VQHQCIVRVRDVVVESLIKVGPMQNMSSGHPHHECPMIRNVQEIVTRQVSATAPGNACLIESALDDPREVAPFLSCIP
jgi:hypothetical protein